MDDLEIAHLRLHNNGLSGPGLGDPVEVVRRLAAVQAQEFGPAKWSLAQRAHQDGGALADEATVQRLLDEGAILRTHALRPTWHFVTATDIAWIQAVTGPRVHVFNGYYNRRHGLDAAAAKKTNKAITGALKGGNHLTRPELAEVLAKAGLEATGNHLAYVVMWAELEGLIASGVMRGKQHTYALVSERAPDRIELTPEDALVELTRRYFTSRGPATVKDFAWWSSLTVAQINKGIKALDTELESTVVDGRTYWSVPGKAPARDRTPTVYALQGYDEYGISYSESRNVGNVAGVDISAGENVMVQPLILDSQIIGTWNRKLDKGTVVVEPRIVVRLTAAQRKAVEREFARYERYLGTPVTLNWS